MNDPKNFFDSLNQSMEPTLVNKETRQAPVNKETGQAASRARAFPYSPACRLPTIATALLSSGAKAPRT